MKNCLVICYIINFSSIQSFYFKSCIFIKNIIYNFYSLTTSIFISILKIFQFRPHSYSFARHLITDGFRLNNKFYFHKFKYLYSS